MTADAPAGLSKQRLEALTDGIFAVAMTLLVIELRMPEHVPGTQVAKEVARLLPKFISWIISFFVLSIFWFSHHRLFHHLRIVDAKLVWLNLFYLGLVSLMPFCSALSGQYGAALFSQVFYSSNMILLSLMGLLKSRHVLRHRELWERTVTPGFYRGARFRTLGLMVVALAAVALASVVPGGGNAAFMLMWPIAVLSRRSELRAGVERKVRN